MVWRSGRRAEAKADPAPAPVRNGAAEAAVRRRRARPETATAAATARACPRCGAHASPGERFCTACGKSLTTKADLGEPVAAGRPTRPRRSWGARARGRVVVPAFLLLALLVAGAAIALLAAAWQSERSGKRHAQQELAGTRADLSATKAKLVSTEAALATTRERLASTTKLSKRQSALLAQTALVLRQVDPLLSDVSRLQQITGSIQAARNTFVSDSSQMTSDLLTLERYVATTNPTTADYTYENQLIGQVDSELANVRGEAAGLTSSDLNYADASNIFGTDADSFTKAVRLLEKQLKSVGR